MSYSTTFQYEFKNMRGETIKGGGEAVTNNEFPDLADNWEGVFRAIEHEAGDYVKELLEWAVQSRRIDIKADIKSKGWKMKDVASRWGITPRQMSNISASPGMKDWDAVDGLPQFDEEVHVY